MNRFAQTGLTIGLLTLTAVPALAGDAERPSPPTAAVAPADAKLAAVRARAAKAKLGRTEEAEKQVETAAQEVQAEASAKGDAAVASRLATRFGVTADDLLAERSKFNAGWGELLIANTLVASSKTGLAVDQVFQLRGEGMGWGQIAHGMGLKLGDVASAARSEGRVAKGLADAPGHRDRTGAEHGHSSVGVGLGAGGASHTKAAAGSQATGASLRGRSGK